MKEMTPYKIRKKLKDLKYWHPYLHTMVKSFFIIMAVVIAFLIFLSPQAICVWFDIPGGLLLYFLVIPFLLGYAHFVIDCLDY